MASMAGASPSGARPKRASAWARAASMRSMARSEEHTSELQSRQYIVCRLLLEKKYTARPGSVLPNRLPQVLLLFLKDLFLWGFLQGKIRPALHLLPIFLPLFSSPMPHSTVESP